MFNVAIDGPAGAGKSTIAKRVAKKNGFIYVDTGAMYRAMALSCLNGNVDSKQEEQVVEHCKDIEVGLRYEGEEQQVLLNGENVNGFIRTEEVGNTASTIAAYAGIRAKLLDIQRQIAGENNVVMDGRDIGTHVLPNAQCKIYLTASSATRAKRRYDELTAKGQTCDLSEIEKDIIERDHRDMNREIAPLKQAEDAVYLDTSELNIEEVVTRIEEIMEDSGWK